MSLNIPSKILSLKGQRINQIQFDNENNKVLISCCRDKRCAAVDPVTGLSGRINTLVKRQVRDMPLLGRMCTIEIELAQVYINKNERRIERSPFVDKGAHFTHRFCRLVSGLCRHMSIQAVSKHLKLRWETTKNIDKNYLQQTLPALEPGELQNLKYIGVDEVARAKGHDYMTVVYDMVEGHLIWVESGRTADVFSSFLKQLPTQTAANIKAVAMDMGPSYQKSVRDCLPNTDIVFDRFHVMKMYGDAIKNQRRTEFRKANKKDKELMKGCHYLLLKNAHKLNDKQADKLHRLLAENANMNTLYLLKEQLQMLWCNTDKEVMGQHLEQWCELAEQTNMTYIRKFATSLKKHKTGICNYAKHQLTSARIEAGNVAIGMIRKRARGITDTEYFKLKIRQSSIPDEGNMFYETV